MDKTPTIPRSKLSLSSRHNLFTGSTARESEENERSNTPVRERNVFTDLENSPTQIACTQEGSQNVDVIWDWNSPQAKQGPKRMRTVKQSPNIPLKRHPSNNCIQNFEKVREELQSLKEEISVPDNEASLQLSPQEEAEYKDISNLQNSREELTLITENRLINNNEEDLFDDFDDEQLLLFSQKIEAELNSAEQLKNHDINRNNGLKSTKTEQTSSKERCKRTNVKDNNLGFRNIKNTQGEMFVSVNDSFDRILQGLQVEQVEGVTKIIDKNNLNKSIRNEHNFPRTRSQNQYRTSKQINTGKVEFHRTRSFEFSVDHTKGIIPQSTLDEIERKRKEALAKLELKRKHGTSDSPIKCTPEEIERKRLQALAKREAKRQQEIIERKRQEALKRLELNRKKNATMVKSSLSKRL